MRSLKLCLLVFLTSCMLDTINANAETEFCADKTSLSDCDNKATIDGKDFSWTIASSFDNQKEMSDSEYVEIDMHRALHITKLAADLSNVNFKTNDDQCQIYFNRVGSAYKSGKIANQAFSVGFDAKSMVTLAVVDPKCRVYAKKLDFAPNNPNIKLFHIFLRNLKTSKLDDSALSGATVPHGNFIFSQQYGHTEGNVDSSIVASNSFFKIHSELGGFYACNHQCKYGNLFVYKVKKDATAFANKFKMNSKCEWMSIHLNSLQPQQSAEISLRHGFVKLPTEVKVYAMDFEVAGAPPADPDNGVAYEVNVLFVVVNEGSSQPTRKIEITNSHGRAVRSYAVDGNTETIRFAFSHDTCLTNQIGSEFKDVSGSLVEEGFEFGKKMNIARKVGQEPSWKANSYYKSKAGPAEEAKYKSKDSFKFARGEIDADIKEIFYVTPTPISTLKPITLSPNASHPADPEIEIVSLSEEETKRIAEQQERVRLYMEKEKRISEGSYHFYWAIPAGFATGSFGTFILCNILLFIFNRSILTFWYKAMYKRYGSDTTMGAGTTMGKTVGGETIGGGTTMGGTTAGGTTAGGETTGSTTAA